MSLTELIEQSGKEKVNDYKDVKVSVIRDKKITTTIASIILAGGKLSTTSTKVTLSKSVQDIRVKKV